MRLILAASALLLVASLPQTAAAVEYPWCAHYGDSHGGINCGFTSLEQCRATISGNGGVCERNPYYAWQAPEQPAPRKPKRAQ